MYKVPSNFKQAASDLSQVGKFFALQGWSPATSSNYSVKLDDVGIAISRSGIDKFQMQPEDVIIINQEGQVLFPKDERPSAETLIHLKIYDIQTDAKCVLHTHSPFNTRISMKYEAKEHIELADYEILKGFTGVMTHKTKIRIPIFSNSQDMLSFCKTIDPVLRANINAPGFLIAGHGLYTWGKDLPTAKRHVETFEFLFSCLAYEALGF